MSIATSAETYWTKSYPEMICLTILDTIEQLNFLPRNEKPASEHKSIQFCFIGSLGVIWYWISMEAVGTPAVLIHREVHAAPAKSSTNP